MIRNIRQRRLRFKTSSASFSLPYGARRSDTPTGAGVALAALFLPGGEADTPAGVIGGGIQPPLEKGARIAVGPEYCANLVRG